MKEDAAMAATDTLLTRAQPWLRGNLRERLRIVLPLPILALAWWFAAMPLSPMATLGLVVYALVNLGLLGLLRWQMLTGRSDTTFALLIVSALSDAALAGWTLAFAGPLTLGIFPIYVVFAIKALRYRRQFLWVLLVPALLGPLYLSALYLQGLGPERLTADQFVAYWGLVFGTVAFVALVLLLSEYRLREWRRLSAQIEQLRNEHSERVHELEGANNDLRGRIRRQQALEESLRAITGSLSLNAVLSQILDSMIQMLGSSRVSAAALSLVENTGFTHHTITYGSGTAEGWAEPLARYVVDHHATVVVGDAQHESEWQMLPQSGMLAALSVPLVAPDGIVRGALTVVSAQPHAFTPTETRHLTSFSIQASVAIHNAALHTALASQRKLLEAVLRDIGDGLFVFDVYGQIVLSNPSATQALQHNDSFQGTLRETMAQLNVQLREAEMSVASRVLKIGEGEHERHYQLYGSLVYSSDDMTTADVANHVAIVVHDITHQKLQERARVEFISMVSHELRNPLNTLNGFLKVVLQGKAGELNELQREFLGLADSQADALKGRITELLEFNRLESGRMRVQPQWADLTDLILQICSRFQIQSEQFDLVLDYDLPEPLPPMLMDSGRIGQVLTNLIENAMKATPAGGSILVSASVHDNEVQVHVRDTGVGIALEQQEKIFSQYYRLEDRNSKHGVHLGLGLSICQQIVEGHNGRIWVESTPGQGSRFTFSLPIVTQVKSVSAVVAS
jgi:signal transduction histidine kinase